VLTEKYWVTLGDLAVVPVQGWHVECFADAYYWEVEPYLKLAVVLDQLPDERELLQEEA
jgi:hypothetical protein